MQFHLFQKIETQSDPAKYGGMLSCHIAFEVLTHTDGCLPQTLLEDSSCITSNAALCVDRQQVAQGAKLAWFVLHSTTISLVLVT